MDFLALTLAPWSAPALPAWGLGVAVLVALAVDRCWGEPPVRFHPVVWMGHYLGWAGKRLQHHTRQSLGAVPDYQAFWLGALAWCAGAALVLIAAVALQQALVQPLALVAQGGWGRVGGTLLAAVLLGGGLKPLLAWALLKNEVLAVEKALAPQRGGSLAAGRERLRWLVSRDVTQLTEAEVRESAIETLAENLNDSVVAPLFWFVLLGLPGAALYRFANTADAMWGYRGLYQGRNWEWAGKWAARADDVLSWLPARLTALMVALAAGGVSLVHLRTEARRTASPNSGWPMAAMALGLGVCLHKPGVYALNPQGRAPTRQDTQRALVCASNGLFWLVGIAQAAIIFIAIG